MVHAAPYRSGQAATSLDLTTTASLFVGLLGGFVGSTLESLEMSSRFDHALMEAPPPAPRGMGDLEPWGSAQVISAVGVGALVFGMCAIPTALMFDLLGSCGRRQRKAIGSFLAALRLFIFMRFFGEKDAPSKS